MAILACFPFWILLNHVNASSSFATVGIVSILAGLTSGATGPIVKATLQNVTLPQSRGQAFALFNTFDDFGRGLGPVFVSVLITRLGGRTPAFNIGVLGWMVCGLFNLMAFFTVERDERVCQTTIAAGLSRNQVDTNSDESGFSVDFVVERDDPLATTKRRPIPVV
jgi:MFS family permease